MILKVANGRGSKAKDKLFQILCWGLVFKRITLGFLGLAGLIVVCLMLLEYRLIIISRSILGVESMWKSIFGSIATAMLCSL